VLEDMAAGQPVRRRDGVALARMVLERRAVRAAEALLEAADCELPTRLAALLDEVLVPLSTEVDPYGALSEPLPCTPQRSTIEK
jgi:hypothetical protein